MMEYKGYHAEVVYDTYTNYWCGKLYGIRDLITFGGDTEKELEEDFHSAVDDYLEFCKENNCEPKRELNPNFSFQVNPEIYKSLLAAAKKVGKTPDELIEKILAGYLAKTA